MHLHHTTMTVVNKSLKCVEHNVTVGNTSAWRFQSRLSASILSHLVKGTSRIHDESHTSTLYQNAELKPILQCEYIISFNNELGATLYSHCTKGLYSAL